MKLTEEDRKFLSCLKSDGGPTGSWSIPTATRAQDRARTRAKKYGWAVFDRKAWAWRITDAGRQALKGGE
ncbi:hypothetical protein FGI60_02825 [Brucella haematophila]|nr:hypothetical protein [Brucella haematophila]TMV05001.1 hypothetical protein FGI60_02825 [Brucella haematophila]